jgi:hypothetical protein
MPRYALVRRVLSTPYGPYFEAPEVALVEDDRVTRFGHHDTFSLEDFDVVSWVNIQPE